MQTPYEQYKNDPLWATIDSALSDLVANGDLTEQTGRDYIVGYTAMKIRSASLKSIETQSRLA
jgi:hypothetical protein